MLFYQSPPRAPERRSHHVSTTEIVVATPPAPYAIRIGAGLLDALGEELDAAGFPRRRILVSSPVVWRLFGERVQASLPGVPVVLAPDGERHKTLKTVSTIYDALLRLGADRGTGIVAVGGGVLGDSAGFAAASFLRGLALAQVPTTLLAQVDSSVGGKVGVNHPLGKNLIGAFHQPRLVAVDPLVLETLPRREFRAGLYEVVKYGMTSSRDLFDRVNGRVSKIFRALGGGDDADHRRELSHQGRGRRGGRARRRHSSGTQLRPHRRTCARGRHEVQAPAPRRSGRLRDAGGVGALGRARPDAR